MFSDKEKEAKLRKAFLEISRGCSVAEYNDELLYIKHFNIFDQERLDLAYQRKLKKLQKQGISSEADRLKEIEEEGKWGDKQKKQIAEKEVFIKNLQNTKKALVIPAQKAQIEEKLKKCEEEIAKLYAERDSLLNNTAEYFANRYLNDISIYESFYKDETLNEHFFSQEEFEDLDRKEIYDLVKIYNTSFENISIDVIKHLALSGLFVNYFNINESDPSALFSRPPLELTFYQVNLITYCKIFKSIFKNIPDINDETREDPDKLLELAEGGEKTQAKIDQIKQAAQKGNQSRAQSIMGAKKEDLKGMGMEEEGTMSIQDFLKQKGKTSFSLIQDGDIVV